MVMVIQITLLIILASLVFFNAYNQRKKLIKEVEDHCNTMESAKDHINVAIKVNNDKKKLLLDLYNFVKIVDECVPASMRTIIKYKAKQSNLTLFNDNNAHK